MAHSTVEFEARGGGVLSRLKSGWALCPWHTSGQFLPCDAGQDMLPAEQPHAGKAASKKKQKGGKKAASKGAKGPRAASCSTAHAEHSEDGPIVEFFVATPEDAHLEPQGLSQALNVKVTASADLSYKTVQHHVLSAW